MKINSINPFVAAALASATAISLTNAATLLQFGGTANIGTNGGSPPMDESYGDNVTTSNTTTGVVATVGVDGITGTPNIGLAYNPNTGGGIFDSYGVWNGRGGTGNLQTQFDSSTTLDIVFTPTISFGVLITSFDLDEWAGGTNSAINWAILNGSTTIVSGSWTARNTANDPSDLGGRNTITTGMTQAQAWANAGSPITLALTKLGGKGSYMAMDNLAFDQVVPEPSAIALSGLSLGALALRRRRS